MNTSSQVLEYVRPIARTLRLRGPLAADPVARLLHALVLSLGVWYAIWTIVLIPLYPNQGARLGVAFVAELAPTAALVLLRLGLFRQAAVAYLAIAWLHATYRMSLNGGIRSTAQIIYITLPILATWLLGNRAAVWTAVVCLGTALVFMCFDLAGVTFARIIPITPVASWVNLVQAILIGVVPVAHTLRRSRDAVERLRTSEMRLTHAQRLAHVGSWERELETQKSQWSDELFRILGLPGDDPPSLATFLNYVHPDDRERVSKSLGEVPSTSAPIRFDFRIIRPDGEVRFLRTVSESVRNEQGVPVRLVGATRDITEEVTARGLLRDSEERFRRVFEEGPLGLSLIGKDRRFLNANRAFCEMVGYSEAELRQLTFMDITHPEDLPPDLELSQRLFRGEIAFFQLRKRYLKKSGETVWVNLTASLVRNAEGKPMYGIAMIEDITEVKRTQDEALARQKLETLGVLAGGIAHDFNNLLGAILAEAELIEMDTISESPAHQEIQRIKAAAIRGAEIVRELMVYAGQEQPGPAERVDLSGLVEGMLELLNVSVSKHVVLNKDLQEPLPPVWGNASQLRQVVMNLVINASEAIGGKDGIITVTTSQAAATVDLPPGDYVKLEVADTGSGIPKEATGKIFDPFFTTKFAGRGLGLAVVDGIVRAHHGGVHIVSAPGQGTVFQVFLPCVIPSTPPNHTAV